MWAAGGRQRVGTHGPPGRTGSPSATYGTTPCHLGAQVLSLGLPCPTGNHVSPAGTRGPCGIPQPRWAYRTPVDSWGPFGIQRPPWDPTAPMGTQDPYRIPRPLWAQPPHVGGSQVPRRLRCPQGPHVSPAGSRVPRGSACVTARAHVAAVAVGAPCGLTSLTASPRPVGSRGPTGLTWRSRVPSLPRGTHAGPRGSHGPYRILRSL